MHRNWIRSNLWLGIGGNRNDGCSPFRIRGKSTPWCVSKWKLNENVAAAGKESFVSSSKWIQVSSKFDSRLFPLHRIVEQVISDELCKLSPETQLVSPYQVSSCGLKLIDLDRNIRQLWNRICQTRVECRSTIENSIPSNRLPKWIYHLSSIYEEMERSDRTVLATVDDEAREIGRKSCRGRNSRLETRDLTFVPIPPPFHPCSRSAGNWRRRRNSQVGFDAFLPLEIRRELTGKPPAHASPASAEKFTRLGTKFGGRSDRWKPGWPRREEARRIHFEGRTVNVLYE